MTPIIDREIFFGNPEIIGGKLSPDGKYLAFIKPYRGVRNIWIKPTEAPFDQARPVTADTTRPIPSYFWTWDSKYLIYVQDKGGNENFHVYVLNPFGETTGEANVPAANNLSPIDNVRAVIYQVPKSNPDKIFVGLNDRDPSWHDLYEISVSSGERTMLFENTAFITDWYFDLDDQMRLAEKATEEGGMELFRVTDNGLVSCFECTWEESFRFVRFHEDNQRFYLITNKGFRDLSELILFDPINQKIEPIASDPEKTVDISNAYFSEKSNQLIATLFNGDKPRYYYRDEAFEADYKWLQGQLPKVEVELGRTTKDENLWLIHGTSDVDPGATYLFNREEKTLTFQYRPRPALPIEHLSHMEPVRYASFDGLEVPAYLTIPKGMEPKHLPAILLIHGGPWARDYWGYDGFAQFLANRGYVVLQPNFRGSTGFGKRFLNAGNGEWGKSMQDDVTAGAKFLINKGIADPDRIGIMGGSYGGYATLAGVTFTPEVYAAGVSIVGPSNLMTLLNSIPPYWESIRKLFYKRIGDPNTEEGRQFLENQSPLFYAQDIKVPLLVVQGANDPRVKQAESDQIVVAMRELGLPVEYLVAPDEGHGFVRPENNIAFVTAVERFLALHLGGRYQESVPPHIQSRLDDITVDINQVNLGKDLPEIVFPKIVIPIQESSCSYSMEMMTGDQRMEVDVLREIRYKGDQLIISDAAESLMGEIIDRVVMDKNSGQPIEQEIIQGPSSILIEYGAEEISGTVTLQSKQFPFQIPKAHAIVGAGIARNILIAALPLHEGYETAFLSFNPQHQKIETFRVKVVGKEEVLLKAGKFSAFKIESTSVDGKLGTTTIWIEDGPGRKILKSHAFMPQIGGTEVSFTLTDNYHPA